MALLARLADPSVAEPPARCLLLPADDVRALPVLDEEPLPVLSANQWLRLPALWYAGAGTRAS